MQETIRHIYLKYIWKGFYCIQRPVRITQETLRGDGLDLFPKKAILAFTARSENKKISKTTNKFNVLTDIQVIRSESVVNLLENKYDGALSTYQTYNVVRMMIEIIILMLHMST